MLYAHPWSSEWVYSHPSHKPGSRKGLVPRESGVFATRKRNVRADKNRGPPQWVVQPGLLVWDFGGVLVPQARLGSREEMVGWVGGER